MAFSQMPEVMAVTKAYSTRVGEGPFPTECPANSAFGKHLQEKGQEFGATTGRKRRCGWLDLPALRYAIRLNGANRLALMKLDVLTKLKEIKVCTAYEIESGIVKDFPLHLRDFSKVQPVYESFQSWEEDLSAVQSIEELPALALDYVNFISRELNIPIDILSLGPSRSQTLCLKEFF